MLLRREYKFLVSYENLDQLREMLKPYVDRDAYSGKGKNGGYTVRSIYFDSPNFNFYNEKIAGVNIRKKVRIRGYNEEDADNKIFLEIKRKNGDVQFKNRAPVRFRNLHDLFESSNIDKYIISNNGFNKGTEDARRFFYNIYKGALLPVVLVIYEREAYVGRFDRTTRVTFDTHIRSSAHPSLEGLYSDERVVHSLQGYFILEVKFNSGFPIWMKPINRALNLNRLAISKYVIAIEDNRLVSPMKLRTNRSLSRLYYLRNRENQD